MPEQAQRLIDYNVIMALTVSNLITHLAQLGMHLGHAGSLLWVAVPALLHQGMGHGRHAFVHL